MKTLINKHSYFYELLIFIEKSFCLIKPYTKKLKLSNISYEVRKIILRKIIN